MVQYNEYIQNLDIEQWRDRCEEAEAERDALREQLDEAVAMLRSIQHSAFGIRCPVCSVVESVGHAPDCRLAALLKKHE